MDDLHWGILIFIMIIGSVIIWLIYEKTKIRPWERTTWAKDEGEK
jgi:hypothetical protein